MKKTELENLQNIISCFCGKTTKKNNDCDGSHWACVGDFLLSKKTYLTLCSLECFASNFTLFFAHKRFIL